MSKFSVLYIGNAKVDQKILGGSIMKSLSRMFLVLIIALIFVSILGFVRQNAKINANTSIHVKSSAFTQYYAEQQIRSKVVFFTYLISKINILLLAGPTIMPFILRTRTESRWKSLLQMRGRNVVHEKTGRSDSAPKSR